MISDFVSGKADLNKMKCRDISFWETNDINLFVGKKAIRLDLTQRTVELEGGENIGFKKLLLATGGQPFVPNIEGIDKDGTFTFTTLSEAERLSVRLESAKRAVVIGAGLIGISVAESLVKRGLKVTLVELKDKILNLILDPEASDMMENALLNAGVNVVTGQSVQRIVGKPETNQIVDSVVLTSGEKLSCDVVIVAIGVVPRIDLVSGTDIETRRGILVDKFMCTNIADVFAAGDVAEAYDFVLNENRLLPLWPLAFIEGRIAGYNMSGCKTEYDGGTSMSALKYFNTPIISVGTVNPKETNTYEVLIKRDVPKGYYKNLVLKEDQIVGMTFIGNIEKAGIFFYLLKNGARVKEFKDELMLEEFGLANLPKALREKMDIGV